jgi:hypothetical protein
VLVGGAALMGEAPAPQRRIDLGDGDAAGGMRCVSKRRGPRSDCGIVIPARCFPSATPCPGEAHKAKSDTSKLLFINEYLVADAVRANRSPGAFFPLTGRKTGTAAKCRAPESPHSGRLSGDSEGSDLHG